MELTRLKNGRSWQARRILPFGDGALTILCVVRLSRPAVREIHVTGLAAVLVVYQIPIPLHIHSLPESSGSKTASPKFWPKGSPVAASHGGSFFPVVAASLLAAPGTLVPQFVESLRLSEPVTKTQCPGFAGSGTTAPHQFPLTADRFVQVFRR